MYNLRIIGIDPGSIICGYGVIEQLQKNKFKLIEYGAIKAKKHYEELPMRLKEIYLRISEVLKRTNPEIAAIESTFFSKNVQSLVKLAHARAVVMLASTLFELPIFEYSPREVKKSVTGKGAATKEQVSFMVKNILNIKETPDFLDVTDALAVALCYAMKGSQINNKPKSWEEFIKEHPERIKKNKLYND